MIQDWKTFLENGYDFQEALERQNLKIQDLNLLRQMTKQSRLVPRSIHDKQV